MRGHPVDLVIADHPRFMQQRVMAEDRTQIAPMTIEIMHARGGRRAAEDRAL